MKLNYIILFLFSIIVASGFAQDTIVFKNGDQIIGELKSLDKGVISFETDYSDSDFKIEWKGVDHISTETIFLITTSEGERLSGTITKGDSTSFAVNNNGNVKYVKPNDIVYLNSLDQGFWSKIYANVDVGFNITKAKNLRQFTVNSGIGFNGENWVWKATYNTLNATQDSISPTKRADGGFSMNRFLVHDMFLTSSINFLSNTEQLLNLRTNITVGFGYYLIHSNKWYWNGSIGVSGANEDYSSGEGNLQSLEAFISTELNLFDFGDLSFFTKIVAYPGISQAGRFRSDINMDLKYDLPLDFYIKTGLTVNYDNQPTIGASEMDYVLNTGFGWEW